MVGKWLVALTLLVDFNRVTLQPITKEGQRLDLSDCCPCPDTSHTVQRAGARDGLSDGITSERCSCQPRSDDAEASASILLPAFRAMQPFVKQLDKKTEPKPLLQPEVGLASSVLETLQQATNEEYQEALARDAARSAVKLIESNLNPLDDVLIETPESKLRVFLNAKDDMNDNLPEPSHIQETRCIHTPLKSIHKNGQLRISRPTPIIEVIDLSPKPTRKLKNKSIFHKKILDMDNGIGASNIQECIEHPVLHNNLESENLESKPVLLSLSAHNHVGRTEDQKGLQKNIGHEYDLGQKVKPKIHLKLRELLDNLEAISKNEKSKIQLIDLKRNFSTTTRIPPLQFKSIEKPVYHYKPMSLKDILKLKDVELIPRNSLTKNTVVEKSSYPNFKLRSESSNSDIDNCEGGNSDFTSIMNKDIKTRIDPFLPEIIDIDTETSPTNSNPIFESKNNEANRNINQHFVSFENTLNSENIDIEGQDNFDYGEMKLDNEQIFSDNCKESTGISFMQQSHNNVNQKQSLNNNGSPKGEAKKWEDSKDKFDEDSNNKGFEIDLLEDFDTPIEFDNSTFIQKSSIKNNDDIQQIENTLKEHDADSSNQYLHIEKQYNENPDIPQVNLKKIIDDCNSKASLSKKFNFISEQQKSTDQIKELNSMQPLLPTDDMNPAANNAFDFISNVNENPNQISFRDLQNMSNSILTLSECEPPREENSYTKSNINEGLDQFNNDYDISNPALPTPVFEINSMEKETEDTLDQSYLNSNSNLSGVSGINSNEKICKSTTSFEMPSDINEFDSKKTFNTDLENSEMRAEATVAQSNLYSPMIPLIPNGLEIDKNLETFRKGLNDITKIDKNSNFLNNLKSKLGSLFSTTAKVTESDVLSSLDDNTNESSNISPNVAKLTKLKNLDKSQRMPQTLLTEILPLEFPELSLNSYKNKLVIPKYVDQQKLSNLGNFLNFPLGVSTSFDGTLDPSSTFAAFSDRLRSHTENTIQNVKQTLESTLKDFQNVRVNGPDTIDSNNILEALSNRRDEMKEKLEGIHLDLNDRFSSLQQSFLDHFNMPIGNSELQEDSSNGVVKASYIPVRKEISLPETKLRNVKQERVVLPRPENISNIGKNTKISLLSTMIPEASDAARFQNSVRNSFVQSPVSYSTTTAIPSFIPRTKVLKTNIDSRPNLTSEKLSKVRPSKIAMLTEVKVPELKSSLFKSRWTSNLSEEPHSLPSSSSRLNMPVKSSKSQKVKIDSADLSIEAPVNKLRKTLLQKNVNQKSRNELTKNRDLGTSNLLNNNGHTHTEQIRRMKEGSPRLGSRDKNELMISPTSHVDTIHPHRNDAGLRLVQPMEENVPYKCKLICYKDS